ncbi:Uncharacterized protein YqfA, UPF0365 family [Seinonella peptonophila]|uniref:Flotillin-like protein FloA n=1 Tax=Seinonella peptonophila TaxID=112248 RepID=A0A1M4V7U1_9BACL|nr:flotillin-like protein FloA [Seinonella peptonophila]SHE64957.1 Uncharacterized protein YqfA, UPF0365 family [Seinonella peptonophila]
MGSESLTIILFSILIIALLMLVFTVIPITLWISTIASGLYVKLSTLIGLRLRRIRPIYIIDPFVRAKKAGLELEMLQLEAHFLAGGNLNQVVNALVTAKRANVVLGFDQATAIDLAGHDILEAVQLAIRPKVIHTPEIVAITKDGIELHMLAQITIRASLDQYIGGAGEPTIIARVGEGLISVVGLADSHKEVLEYPDQISKKLLEKSLDADTAFKIISIDLTDLQIGQNIAARIEAEQAEVEKRIVLAKADERRSLALAQEQEMKARVERMRAKMMEAEAKVPIAVSDALRSGKLGVLDYYKLKNIEADTAMRNHFSFEAGVGGNQTVGGGK